MVLEKLKDFRKYTLLILVLMWLGLAKPAYGHVKWFSDFTFLEPPLSLREIITPTYLSMVILSIVVIAGMIVADRQLAGAAWYQRINAWFSEKEAMSVTIMRVAMAGVLLVSWASDSVLTPELTSSWNWLVWLQFVVAILLLFPRTTSLAGAGLLFIYLCAIFEFGLFHMLDYLHYLGIGVYLLVANSAETRIKGLGLPALFIIDCRAFGKCKVVQTT